jgi:hypothetical protein
MLTNGTHTLTSFQNDSLDHCILVKLTDTSAKYIQEFMKSHDSNKKASLKFCKGTGEIIFSNTQTKDAKKLFKFGVSNITGSSKDATASFECVSYKNRKLQSLNAIEEKIIVQATEEAFQVTKEKLLSVFKNEEEKKNSVKEINQINRNQRKRKMNENIDKPAKRLQKSPNPSISNNDSGLSSSASSTSSTSRSTSLSVSSSSSSSSSSSTSSTSSSLSTSSSSKSSTSSTSSSLSTSSSSRSTLSTSSSLSASSTSRSTLSTSSSLSTSSTSRSTSFSSSFWDSSPDYDWLDDFSASSYIERVLNNEDLLVFR